MLISIPAEQEPAFVVVVLALLIRPHPEVLVNEAARGTQRPLGGPPKGSQH